MIGAIMGLLGAWFHQLNLTGKQILGLIFVKKAVWGCWLTRVAPTALGLKACAQGTFLSSLASGRKSPLQTVAGMRSRRVLASQAHH